MRETLASDWCEQGLHLRGQGDLRLQDRVHDFLLHLLPHRYDCRINLGLARLRMDQLVGLLHRHHPRGRRTVGDLVTHPRLHRPQRSHPHPADHAMRRP